MIGVPRRANLPATTEASMEQHGSVITHPKFRMQLRPDGIVQLVWIPRTTALLEDATATLEAIAQLTGGRRSPLMVDMRDIGPQARAARLEFARRGDLVSAVALVVGTPLSRMAGNLFINMNRPPTPTRLFDKEAAAVAWLQGFVGERKRLN
jgi:hypothetical protein